jgi:prepilin-type processing-associated H-X9-DG protein
MRSSLRAHGTIRGSRLAFSRADLVVVLCFAGLLAVLAVPAVAEVREAAARTTCADNLRRLGTALIAHNDGRGALPSDWTPGTSFYGAILPYVGRENHRADWVAHPEPIELFLCPSRRSVTAGPKDDYATSHHPGSWLANPATPGDASSVLYGYLQGLSELSRPAPTLDQIASQDGTARTLLLAEKGMDPKSYGRIGMVPRDRSWSFPTNQFSSWGDLYERVRCPFGFRRDRDGGYSNAEVPHCGEVYPGTMDSLFGSAHLDGLNALFADGSVRALAYSTSSDICWRLWAYNDGENVP